MGKMSDHAIDLLQDYGDEIDIYYTQFLEVSFFLKVPANERLAIAFIKRKIPVLSEDDISYVISVIVGAYQDTL
tara:strand:+ start:392 stop:613 length:222 start_codon:yes stop_codon:yes gene_type:complete